MSSYLTYYLAWTVLAYAAREPVLLVGMLVFLVFRRYIPEPGAIWRALGRASSLASQCAVNPANVTARRDLAVIRLDLRRPRSALALIEQALARAPDDPELLFLSGLALHRAGRHADALPPLVRSLELRPKLRYGEPYVVAGDALLALRRVPEAIDAYERYACVNHSDVRVHVQLARAFAREGDHGAVRAALAKAIDTWHHIPPPMRRRAFGRWLEAQWLRARLLGDPGVIVTGLVITAALVGAARYGTPHLRAVFSRTSNPYAAAPGGPLIDAFKRCGTQSTGDFAGTYTADPEASGGFTDAAAPSVRQPPPDHSSGFTIFSDRIQRGAPPIEDYCLTRTLDRTPTSLHAEAIWREDLNDPGDASLVEIRLARAADEVTFTFIDPESKTETRTRLHQAH